MTLIKSVICLINWYLLIKSQKNQSLRDIGRCVYYRKLTLQNKVNFYGTCFYFINPCATKVDEFVYRATKVLAPLLYEFLGEQEIRIRDYFTASSVFFIFNKDLIIFFDKKHSNEFSALLKISIKNNLNSLQPLVSQIIVLFFVI